MSSEEAEAETETETKSGQSGISSKSPTLQPKKIFVARQDEIYCKFYKKPSNRDKNFNCSIICTKLI